MSGSNLVWPGHTKHLRGFQFSLLRLFLVPIAEQIFQGIFMV